MPAQIKKRESLTLSSPRKHAVLAWLLFFILMAAPFIYTASFGKARDSYASGSVKVSPIKEVAALAPLNDETLLSPDLLASEIGLYENPTEILLSQNPRRVQNGRGAQNSNAQASAVDALGNPIAQNGPSDDGQTLSDGTNETLLELSLAGGDAITNNQSSESGDGQAKIYQGAKTILIDDIGPNISQLPAAPIAAITTKNQYGSVPKKAANGRSALNSYNRPFKTISGRKPISIIIGGLGVNRSVTQQAIDTLPPEVTLSFAAHAISLQDWVTRARNAGHEVMIEIPMDSVGFDPNAPGADKALRVSNTEGDNLRKLDYLLSRAQGYFGVINYNGDNFLTRSDMAVPILTKLSDIGVGFITDGAFSLPTLSALSQSVALPYKHSFGLIDPQANSQTIRTQLANLSQIAQTDSAPIGVGFAYPETIEAVTRWSVDLEQKGLVLAPASHSLIQ